MSFFRTLICLFIPASLFAQAEEDERISPDFTAIFDNQLAKIELIALQNYCCDEDGAYTIGVTAIYTGLSDEVHLLNQQRLALRKELALTHYELLCRLLFTPSESNLYGHSLCYYPRHAILFSSASGEVLAYFEICFECQERRLLGTLPSIVRFDDKRWNELKELFAIYQFPFINESSKAQNKAH